MTGAFYVEIEHRMGGWIHRLLAPDRSRMWFRPDVPYTTEDEAFAAIHEHYEAACRASAEFNAECDARGSRTPPIRPTSRWRIVYIRQTPWAPRGWHTERILDGVCRIIEQGDQ